MRDEVITPAEAARRLGISRQRVEQLMDAGTLPSTPRVVRGVRAADVARLKERRIKATESSAASP